MITIPLAIVILLDILTWFVIFDVIISWLMLFWVKFRPAFISSILDPIYKWIKSVIPTTIWPFELTPIILIFFFLFAQGLIFTLFPEVQVALYNVPGY